MWTGAALASKGWPFNIPVLVFSLVVLNIAEEHC